MALAILRAEVCPRALSFVSGQDASLLAAYHPTPRQTAASSEHPEDLFWFFSFAFVDLTAKESCFDPSSAVLVLLNFT